MYLIILLIKKFIYINIYCSYLLIMNNIYKITDLEVMEFVIKILFIK